MATSSIPLKGLSRSDWGKDVYLHEKRFDQPTEPFLVEMGGLEPPSKHRTKRLSTRLVWLWFSSRGCRQTGHPRLILWILAELKGVTPSIRFG